MNHSSVGPRSGEPGLCAWIGFWVQLLVLGVLAVLGAFFASADRHPGDYACGLVLSLAALALAAMRLKRRFDIGGNEAAGGWAEFLLVDDPANLTAVIVAFAALGLGGLVLAARFGEGGLQDGGVALFVASAIGVFLSLKHVFDRLDRGG